MTQREQEHNQIWAQEGENTTNSPMVCDSLPPSLKARPRAAETKGGMEGDLKVWMWDGDMGWQMAGRKAGR